jgi:hypothetical protein
MNRLALSILGSLAIAATSLAIAVASPPNLAGTWTVEQNGLNGGTTTKITLQQSGNGLVGSSSTGNGFTGEFVTDTQINGKWHGPSEIRRAV